MDLNLVFEKEIEKRMGEYRVKNEELTLTINNLTQEVKRLKSLENCNLSNEARKLVTIHTIKNLISFEPTFSGYIENKEAQGMRESPEWFNYLIEYWNDRNSLLDFFNFFGIEFSPWARTMKMPHEWNEEELILFLKNIEIQYVCNGDLFEKNLGWWYKEQAHLKDAFSNPKNMITHRSYTEIPWQFVFENPLWTSDVVFDELVKTIESGKQHFISLLRIVNYHKFDEVKIKKLVKACVVINKKVGYSEVRNFISRNIPSIQINKSEKDLLEYLTCEPPNANSCSIVHEFYIEKIADFVAKISYIEKCNKLTKIEKANLVKKYVLEKYSNVIVAKELLEE